MTKFEREYHEAFGNWGRAMEIVERRTKELREIERQGRREKNSFRIQFIAREYNQRKEELEALEELLERF